LLPNGKVLVAGGLGGIVTGSLVNTELYDIGLGFSSAWQPQISILPSALTSGSPLVINGSGFRGVSEGSGGNVKSSPADFPVVELRSLESGLTSFPGATSWSTNYLTSAPVSGLPPGYTLATVFVNGIPSASRLLRFDTFPMAPIVLTGARNLDAGAFRFSFTNEPGFSFSVLGTTNFALPLSNWTVLGGAIENVPGQFQFTDPDSTNNVKYFYRVRSP
jgi:hypothetical protein